MEDISYAFEQRILEEREATDTQIFPERDSRYGPGPSPSYNWAASSRLRGGVSVGAKAPNFTLKTLDGKSHTLSAYKGKSVVLLDFGRFTCLPCRYVLPDLQKLHARYQGKGVQIFSINLDGPLAPRFVPRGI